MNAIKIKWMLDFFMIMPPLIQFKTWYKLEHLACQAVFNLIGPEMSEI